MKKFRFIFILVITLLILLALAYLFVDFRCSYKYSLFKITTGDEDTVIEYFDMDKITDDHINERMQEALKTKDEDLIENLFVGSWVENLRPSIKAKITDELMDMFKYENQEKSKNKVDKFFGIILKRHRYGYIIDKKVSDNKTIVNLCDEEDNSCAKWVFEKENSIWRVTSIK